MNVGVHLERPQLGCAVKPVPHSRTAEKHRKGQWGWAEWSWLTSLLAVMQRKASLPEMAVAPRPLPPQSLGSCKEEKG